MTDSRGPSEGATVERKAEHLQLALDDSVQLGKQYFDDYRFEHRALPEIDYEAIDTTVDFLGKELAAPLLVSCMTGGTDEAGGVNRNLARGADRCRVAMGVGSQRAALEDPLQVETFQVRDQAPDIPLLANLGAVQLNYGYGAEEARQAVEMVGADALVFHLNPLQEAIQPEGDTNFADLLRQMGEVAGELDVPLVAKEIGCGISRETGRALAERGIRIVDVAGLGGTSWARIEGHRARNRSLGELFSGWGIPTPVAIEQMATVDGLTVIGSGGVRSGLDVAKAIALGADLVGMASPFLGPATTGPEAVVETIEGVVRELEIAMFCVGARSIEELKEVDLLRRAPS